MSPCTAALAARRIPVSHNPGRQSRVGSSHPPVDAGVPPATAHHGQTCTLTLGAVKASHEPVRQLDVGMSTNGAQIDGARQTIHIVMADNRHVGIAL